jgi:bacterioferritin-associated ferredoxin
MKGRLRQLLHEFDNYVDAHIDTALKITTELKNILTSPAADIITAIIPGDIDNTVREGLITALSKITEALTIADNCKECTDINAKLQCFIQQLQQYDPQLQDAILQKLASLLTGFLDGQRLKQSLYDLYTQAKYSITKTA